MGFRSSNRDATLFSVASSLKCERLFPGLAKRNPGLELATLSALTLHSLLGGR